MRIQASIYRYHFSAESIEQIVEIAYQIYPVMLILMFVVSVAINVWFINIVYRCYQFIRDRQQDTTVQHQQQREYKPYTIA